MDCPGCFLKKYAICSLKNCTENLPVILFTDERDKDYINGVKKIFQDIDFKFIDGEALAQYLQTRPKIRNFSENFRKNVQIYAIFRKNVQIFAKNRKLAQICVTLRKFANICENLRKFPQIKNFAQFFANLRKFSQFFEN